VNIREYEIIEQIGEPGGMGTVYKARHKNLEVIRAIKKLHFHLAHNETIIKRFENEAKALIILEHPNIVKVYDFFREKEDYYLVMEYIEGSSLAEHMGNSPLNEQLAINYFMQVLSTIEFAHSKKILHRDIKPSNILITKDNIIKVVDFGIAKIMDRKGLTSTGVTVGSPRYMSPEQIVGYEIDERSEIYSLGITFFEMLTGEVPFNDTSEYKIFEKHQKEKMPSLKSFNKNFSSKLDVIIRKATSKKPDKRYQNAQEFAEAIDKYLALCALGDKTVTSDNQTNVIDSETTIIQPKGDTLNGIRLDVTEPDKKIRETQKEDTLQERKPVESESEEELTGIRKKEIDKTVGQSPPIIYEKEKTPYPVLDDEKVVSEKTKKLLFLSMISIIVLAVVTYFSWDLLTNNYQQNELDLWTEDIGYNSVLIKWRELPDISQYRISRMEPEAAVFGDLTTVTITSFLDTGLIPNTEYTYRITALDENENPLHKNEIIIDTSPINISLEKGKVTKSTISLSWQSLEGITDQILYREHIGGRKNGKIDQVYTGKANVFTDRNLSADQQYSYSLYLKFNNNFEYETDPVLITTEKPRRIDNTYVRREKKPSRKSIINKEPISFGGLYIISEPVGAKIILDDTIKGITPFKRDNIDVGSHRIKLIKEGFADYSDEVNIKSNQISERFFILDRSKGMLNILVKPFGSIYIDGKLHKKDWDRQYTTSIPTGDHTLTVVHKVLGNKWEKQIHISENDKKDISIDFNQKVNITVSSVPTWGEIYVDGRATGITTPKQIKIQIGLHKIGVRRKGFRLVGSEKEINFEQDLSEPITFRLVRVN